MTELPRPPDVLYRLERQRGEELTRRARRSRRRPRPDRSDPRGGRP